MPNPSIPSLTILFLLAAAPALIHAQEIPLQHCDTLPVVQVAADSRAAKFLVDTAATSLLNAASFPQSTTRATDISVTSWRGTLATTAKEVTIAELVVGRTTLVRIKLPAIDLSAIGKACGQKIDGILGADLLGKIGATIDLKRDVLHVATIEEARDAERVSEMQRDTQQCAKAFNDSDEASLADCFDPGIAVFTAIEEIRGREKVVAYFRDRYLHQTPPAELQIHESAFHPMGDAVWYEYDLTIESAHNQLHARGMAMCKKSEGRWRMVTMHHSVVRSDPAVNPAASR
jgi:ketosteroid isomerase-like protein